MHVPHPCASCKSLPCFAEAPSEAEGEAEGVGGDAECLDFLGNLVIPTRERSETGEPALSEAEGNPYKRPNP